MIRRVRAYLALMSQAVGRFAVAKLLALQLLIAMMEGAGLTLLAPVLQSLGGGASLRVPGVGVRLTLVTAFSLVVLVIVIRALGQWRVTVLSNDIRLATIDALRLELIGDLYVTQWRYLASQRRSHLVQRLTSEVERAHNALAMLVRFVVGVFVLLATVGVAVLLSPLIGGLTALLLVLVAALARRSIRTAVQLGEQMTVSMEGFGAAVTDSLTSVRLMRAHDASASWVALVDAEARRVREVRRSFVRKTSAVIATLSVASVVAVLALILVGREAGMSFARLAALVVVASRIFSSTQTLLGTAQSFSNDSPALDRLRKFGEESKAHQEVSSASDARGSAVPDPEASLVSLRDVTVRYRNDAEPVLLGVGLDVPRRGLVTLSGPSGSGKSTLLDVVIGLLQPDSGTVLVDGSPLHDLARWRSRLGYVPQQTVLVPGTVWQNLTWSLAPGQVASRDDAWQALTAACMDDVVRQLPGGLDASLSELTELSGGEQQRLSIARALIRKPELLVLDEATSALDKITEERVLANLLDGSRAVLLVTHRLSDRARADLEAHLEDGVLSIRRADDGLTPPAGRHRLH
jgi:ABC-type multidrug transport system fused ATPase/permease subunit